MTKRHGAATLLCAAVAMATTLHAGQWRDRPDRWHVHEQETQRHTLRFAGGTPRTLAIKGINGSIHVTAYDGRDVELTIEKAIDAESDAFAADARRDVALDLADNAGTVAAVVRQLAMPICGEPWDGEGGRRDRRYHVTFDFTVRVPREARLELCTINNGSIRVEGTRGDFDVRNVNGRITMTDVAGDGSAETVNGHVRASFVQAPQAPSLFKTVNGDVEVTYPDPLAADVRMKTFNGGLFTDFDVQPLLTAAMVPTRKGGRFVYRSNNFTTVRIGAGGPELSLETLNGDVRVLRRTR